MKEIKFNEDGTVTIDGEKYAKLGYFQQQKNKLEEARERYPAGTFVKSLVTHDIHKVSYEIDSDEEDENTVYLTTKQGCIIVYDGGKWAEIVTEPLHPTIDDIYDSVKPIFWVDSEEISSYANSRCQDAVATKEDAEYILATMKLINIAAYYNAKYPSEVKNVVFVYHPKFGIRDLYMENDNNVYGQELFTSTAAKEAHSNPHVIEVLQKYFRISK